MLICKFKLFIDMNKFSIKYFVNSIILNYAITLIYESYYIITHAVKKSLNLKYYMQIVTKSILAKKVMKVQSKLRQCYHINRYEHSRVRHKLYTFCQ